MAVMYTADDYRQQLHALLPPGLVWTTEPDSRLQRLLAGIAQELARVDERAAALLIEADPRRALNTFEEWEASHSLPSRCAPAEQSMADRRAALIGRIVGRGGMRPADYIDLAEGLGYVATRVTEFRPATVEIDSPTGYTGAVAGDDMQGDDWASTWRITLPGGVVRQSVVDEAIIGDPLRSWGDELIECSLRAAAPSWLIMQIGYTTGE